MTINVVLSENFSCQILHMNNDNKTTVFQSTAFISSCSRKAGSIIITTKKAFRRFALNTSYLHVHGTYGCV